MATFEKLKTKDGLWRVRVNDGWWFTYETDKYPSVGLALQEAKRWIGWSRNVADRNADSIYYILVVPETWTGPSPDSYAFSGLHMKIGRTNDLPKRLQNLRTGTPSELIVMAIEPGSPQIEHVRHKQFASDRRQGEWFVCSPPLMRHVWHTFHKNNLLPPGHAVRMFRFFERADIYQGIREFFGKAPDMVNPSLNEDWYGDVFVDLVNTNLLKKDGFLLDEIQTRFYDNSSNKDKQGNSKSNGRKKRCSKSSR